MMKLNPEERLSTEDLLRHPYLGAMKEEIEKRMWQCHAAAWI
jgi:hypothetical protein